MSPVQNGPDTRTADELDDEPAPPMYTAVVVRYDDRPDRCTIAPRAASATENGFDTVTTWLTANVDVFVDLEEMR
ncbi:DUF7511 domain-containing protein [Natronosalvus halobius]|uniref:DUF7511 domain-containing protein n=1 Tax=Natronosalvus halobius TaxID=2953746 RepID=UPI0020A0D94C|nr:hypothetical protein [Natronosalvus halobius]USZ72576.1 hypothetical protein NGM15_04480 [Natronosalvus halobius]